MSNREIQINPAVTVELERTPDQAARESRLPFRLIIILLLFSALRPDRLLPGGKILMYFPTVILLILLTIWLFEKNKNWDNKQTKYLLVFCFLMVVHLPFVKNFGYYYTITESFLFYTVGFYLLLVKYLNTYEKFNIYVHLFVGLSIFKALLGILGQGKVPIPVLQDENDFCLFVNTMIPFAFVFAAYAESRKGKLFYLLLFSVLLIANISTFSRGGFVGLVFVGLYLFYIAKNKIRFFIIGIILLSISLAFVPQEYKAEIRTINPEATKEGTGKARVEYWKASWRMFLDHPIIGVGPGNYNTHVAQYHAYGNRAWGRAVHSLYFTLLAELGILGVICFIGILFANFKAHFQIRRVYRSSHPSPEGEANLHPENTDGDHARLKRLYAISLGLCGALIAFLVTGLFISVLWYSYFWHFSALFVAAHCSISQIEQKYA